MTCEKKIEVRRKRSIYQVHYGLKRPDENEEMVKPFMFITRPVSNLEIQKYGLQVAGHQETKNTKYLGVLQCNNGTILKPILKSAQQRENDFYEKLSDNDDKHLVELRKFVPKYYGCKMFTYNGYENEYLILESLTDGMLEPCIIDIKIGRRTWDPLATEEKIRAEKIKYADCKRDVAFCVPGFQVYKLATGSLHKYSKDYGKKLNGTSVREALKTFLNAKGNYLCRSLILQFLTELWKIQKWASKQTAVKLYSTSLLLVYDAQKLRECCSHVDDLCLGLPSKCAIKPTTRRKSIHTMHSLETSGSNFSGQISSKGPMFKKIQSTPTIALSVVQSSFSPPASPHNTPWHDALSVLKRSHSFHHNYEDNLSKMKMDYRAMLDQLSSDHEKVKPWACVKIIDFVHAFFTDDSAVDTNFREGVDNLVRIFEEFLQATENQVFLT